MFLSHILPPDNSQPLSSLQGSQVTRGGKKNHQASFSTGQGLDLFAQWKQPKNMQRNTRVRISSVLKHKAPLSSYSILTGQHLGRLLLMQNWWAALTKVPQSSASTAWFLPRPVRWKWCTILAHCGEQKHRKLLTKKINLSGYCIFISIMYSLGFKVIR